MRRTRRGWRALNEESGWAWISFLFAQAGIPIMLDPGSYAPELINATLDRPLTFIWGLTLTLGGSLVFVSIAAIWPRIERVGLIWLIFAVGLFWLCVIAGNNPDTNRFFSGLVYASIIWAMMARYRQLGKLIKAILFARARSR